MLSIHHLGLLMNNLDPEMKTPTEPEYIVTLVVFPELAVNPMTLNDGLANSVVADVLA
jgi:hypothetical protein